MQNKTHYALVTYGYVLTLHNFKESLECISCIFACISLFYCPRSYIADPRPSVDTLSPSPPTSPPVLEGEELYPVLFSVAGVILLMVVALIIIVGCVFLQ